MARTRPRFADARRQWLSLTAAVLLLAGSGGVWPAPAAAGEPLSTAPIVWYADDAQPSAVPEFAEPGLVNYAIDSFVARPFARFWHPGRFVRRVGTGHEARTAGNVNRLDEVVNSTWFTNRIGLRPLTADELACGPALGTPYQEGPDRSQPWTIIGAKTAGVTPGFRIRDGRGDTWLLKFDPASHPGMTIRSGIVANLILHAIGFNTPVDRLVEFDRADLVIGEGARMKVGRDGTVAMTAANLDSILVATKSVFGGRYHALASRYLDGIPLGPFNDQGLRKDDPNDKIRHENRRELRGLRVFGAWLNHFDTKMHNSLDMYVGEPGAGHVQHFLIDFASTLGGFGDLPVKRFGYEYGLDLWPALGRMLTLGAVEDTWVRVERPEGLDEVGLFDIATFAPDQWKPDLPHSGMANLTARDGYWAAKIISAFSDDDLRLLVEQGRYQNPAAADYLVTALAARRDRIARYWFAEVPPLDFFRWQDDVLHFTDLAVARGYAEGTTRYRYRLGAASADRDTRHRTEWQETDTAAVTTAANGLEFDPAHPFLSVELQVNRGDGWSAGTTVYLSQSAARVVEVRR